MKYVVLGFCAVAAACGGGTPGAPTPVARTIGPVAVHEARNGSDLPFKGTLEAAETAEGPLHRLSGVGTATHLGRFTLASEFTVAPPPASTAVGEATWTAANGDEIFTTVVGQAVITFPVASIIETHTITGGTGRFAEASGSFVVERSLHVQTLISSASFIGTISPGR